MLYEEIAREHELDPNERELFIELIATAKLFLFRRAIAASGFGDYAYFMQESEIARLKLGTLLLKASEHVVEAYIDYFNREKQDFESKQSGANGSI